MAPAACSNCWNSCSTRRPTAIWRWPSRAVGGEVLFVRHQPGPPRVLGPRRHRALPGSVPRRRFCPAASFRDRGSRSSTTPARPRKWRPARPQASRWTARSMSRAATGSLPRPCRPPKWPRMILMPCCQAPLAQQPPRDHRHRGLDGHRTLLPGRVYWALAGHRWVKAKRAASVHRLNINTHWTREDAQQLEATPSARWNWCCRKPFRPPLSPKPASWAR